MSDLPSRESLAENPWHSNPGRLAIYPKRDTELIINDYARMERRCLVRNSSHILFFILFNNDFQEAWGLA